MLKLRIALGLALVTAVLTAAAGMVQEVRPLTILYRTAMTFAGFSLGGFLAAMATEAYYRRRFADIKPKGKKIDIISKEVLFDKDELLNPAHASPQFSPLTPESFEKLTTKTKDQV